MNETERDRKTSDGSKAIAPKKNKALWPGQNKAVGSSRNKAASDPGSENKGN